MIGRSLKIAASCILIGVFLYQYLGIFVSVEMGIHELREEFRQSNPNTLEVIAIPLNSLKDTKEFQKLDASEFRYRGRLYDLARERIKGNTAYFYCHHDAEEEDLQQSFNTQQASWLDAKQAPAKSSSKTFLKIFTQDIILPETQYYFAFSSSKFRAEGGKESISVAYYSVSSPPPEYLFA